MTTERFLFDEASRLAALQAAAILDTPAEASFDDLAQLAAFVAGVPISAISLIDERRQWFKASCGLSMRETPREIAFCDHTIRQSGIFEVPDAHLDPRFAGTPLVVEGPRIRFYAGAPLIASSGHRLGALCVADQEPRRLSPNQQALLAALARQAIRLIEERTRIEDLRELVDAKRRSERRLTVQLATSRVLARGASPRTTARMLLRGLGRALDCEGGTVWRLDENAGRLYGATHWYKDGGDYPAALRPLAPGEGWAGRIWATRQPRMTGNLRAAASDCPQSALAANEGYRSLFGFPIEVKDQVVAVVELVSRHPEPADDDLLQSLGALGRQIGQYLEHLESERALAETNARFQSIVDHNFSALLTMDGYGTIELVNPAAERMFGYSRDELIGRNVALLLSPSLGSDASRYMAEAYTQTRGKVTEWHARRKSGADFPIEVAMFDFPTPQGRRFGGSVLDISERRAVDRMKQEFVSTVNHELRTPLTSIKGSLALLNAGVVGELPEEACGMVALAERNCTRLIGLINDMLDLDRLTNGQIELQIGTVPVRQLIDRSIEAVVGFAENEGICLVSTPCRSWVSGDEERLVQVLVNLLSNAIKFSPPGATVTVEAEELGETLELRVRDEGRGIPAELQDCIFERFRQVEASDARRKGGTGLGLAICKSLVEHHHGSIGVDSELGRGSTFRIRLPLAECRHPLTRSQNIEAELLAEARALIFQTAA